MSEKEIIPGTYVLLSYTAMTEEGDVVESTKKKIKRDDKEEEVDRPIVVKVGSKEIFFDEELVGLKEGAEKEIVLPPEKAYGKRDPSKIERIPVKKLKAMLGGKKPEVGAILYTEGGDYYGKIIYVGARDALVDKNHPFADKTIKVNVKIHKVVMPTDTLEERVNIILRRHFAEYAEKLKVSLVDGEVEITLPSDVALKMSSWELIRNIYANRKLAADELLKELNVNKIRFIDEFALEPIEEEKIEKKQTE